MLKPLTIMAHVLLLLIVSVQAQPALENAKKLCLVGLNQPSQKFDVYLAPEKPVVISCSNEGAGFIIPKFMQFTCEEGKSIITVKINLSDGTHQQTISRDVEVANITGIYELPLLSFVSYEILQTGKGQIKSISFTNSGNESLLLSEIGFSNSTLNYEVKMNQVFTIDLNKDLQKNYYINVGTQKDVSINLYKSNGEFDHSIVKSLQRGENYLHFTELEVEVSKYVVVITDIFPNKKAPSGKITVMY